MNKKLKSKETDYLFDAILSLKNKDECYIFFEDLCTVAEIKAMAQRLCVAKMLDNKHTYADISVKTGASAATISRVAKCLNYGAEGYTTVLKRLGEING
ncbi:MAG TPA: YerC/YecD family TrpR-related protein [Clostridia bacterium]|jgi:TrpR-related protein YerC/YecD|nr:MAG: Trp repressor protein [Firmicutes bacterium ADurb.Bin099]HHT94512.1 TrpR-like protein, YerC/YecD [Clostridiaceae bacterium]HNZ41648.1 YerC/YecD family TrpR-related protein [Clostridia bacterium]HOF26982.1 YerC/YecD family TrpR-related protein [Clostridia bacterium]HOM35194.1 YerC/YecD family TrpR-related protein [Clostridia bacterium]